MFGPKETNIQQYCNYKPNNFFKLFPLRSVDERQVDTTQLVKKDKSYSPDFEKYWYVEKLDSFSEKTHRLFNSFELTTEIKNNKVQLQFVLAFYLLFTYGFRPGSNYKNPLYAGLLTFRRRHFKLYVNKSGQHMIGFKFVEKSDDLYKLHHKIDANIYDGLDFLQKQKSEIIFDQFFNGEYADEDFFLLKIKDFHDGNEFNFRHFRERAISVEVERILISLPKDTVQPAKMLVKIINDVRFNFSNHKKLIPFLHYLDPRVLIIFCNRFKIPFAKVHNLFRSYAYSLDYMWSIRYFTYMKCLSSMENTHEKRFQIYNIVKYGDINDYFY